MMQKRLAVVVVSAVVATCVAGIAPSSRAAFPGTNGLVVFADGTTPAIDLLATSTGAVTQLCAPPVCTNSDRPVTSPDGKTVVFADKTGPGGLWTIPITGGTPVHITGTSGPADFSPSFTADGSTIVFTDAGILSRIPVAGGTETQIFGAPSSASIREAELSPNGSTVAYIDGCAGPGPGCLTDLETIPVAGGTPHVVLTSTKYEDQVSWSPDGTKIALIDFVDCPTTPLAIVSATASSGVPAPTCLANSSVNDFDPSFSPDGTQIAVADFNSGPVHISVLGATGSGRTPFAAAITSGENYWAPGPPACTQVTSTPGQLYVAPGQFVCASNGTIGGNVTVASGGALSLTNETVNGSVSSSGAKTMTICGSRISGAVTISNSTGSVEVGDGGDERPACAGNTLSNVTISGNTANAELGGNRTTGTVNFYNNSGGPGTENSPEVEANTIGGNLNCAGNTSLSNDNLRNTVTGARTGPPCSSSTF